MKTDPTQAAIARCLARLEIDPEQWNRAVDFAAKAGYRHGWQFRRDLCLFCEGEGEWKGTDCNACHGTGATDPLPVEMADGRYVNDPCRECNGQGKIGYGHVLVDCQVCRGRGYSIAVENRHREQEPTSRRNPHRILSQAIGLITSVAQGMGT